MAPKKMHRNGAESNATGDVQRPFFTHSPDLKFIASFDGGFKYPTPEDAKGAPHAREPGRVGADFLSHIDEGRRSQPGDRISTR